MLSLWPELFSFALVAPLLLRLALGGIFLTAGWRELLRPGQPPLGLKRLTGLGHLAIGGLLFIGLWTQLATALAAVEILFYLGDNLWRRHPSPRPLGYLFLMLTASLALLFLGPGFLAFDLPL